MSGKRELVLIAWSGKREFMGLPSLQDQMRGTHNQVVTRRDEGMIWSWVFALPHILPSHPSLPKIGALVASELRAHLADGDPTPIVRAYERWQIPIEVLAGTWRAVDAAMLGWASFQQRDIPAGLRYPWTLTTTVAEVAALFGKYASDFHAKPSDQISIGADGFSHCKSAADPFGGREFPQVYGRMVADEFVEWHKSQLAPSTTPRWWPEPANFVQSRPAPTPPEGSTPFERAAIASIRAIGGKCRADGPYEWCIETPIGPLWCSIGPRAIMCRWENVEASVAQLGRDVNQHSGKWNHYAENPPTETEAKRLVEQIARDIDSLRPVIERRVWEGGVRGE